MMILSLTAIVTGSMNLTDEHYRDYLVWENEIVQEFDMMALTEEKIQTNYADGIQPLRTTTNYEYTTSIMYEWDGCDTLLTVDNIKKMYELEQKILNDPDYGKFCKAVSSSDSSCADSDYSSFAKNFAANINTLTQADIDTKLASISGSLPDYYSNNYFFDKGFSQTNTKAKKARAIFIFANPIEIDGRRFKTYKDDIREQDEYFIEFSDDLENQIKETYGNMDAYFHSITWVEYAVDQLIMKDISLLFASFTLVFIYVAFHLQSLFLASITMLGIVLAYPTTIFINRFIMQITIFNFINYIAVFVILGIAADDVFVFTDCWKQSATFKELRKDGDTKIDWIQKRMNYTWRRTSKAIFTTSITTCVSFVATGFSKLMPISAFGYFAAVLVIVLYVFSITIYPCWVIIFEKYIVHRWKYWKYVRYISRCQCLWKKKEADNSNLKYPKRDNQIADQIILQ
jgi:hypothetical protein